MRLRVLLPHRVFLDVPGVSRLVAEGRAGSMGLLPHRRDCVQPLASGILVYQVGRDAELCLAVDEGVLVKTGDDVTVSVRRASGGGDLHSLRALVEREFLARSEDDKNMQRVMTQLETGFVRRISSLRHV